MPTSEERRRKEQAKLLEGVRQMMATPEGRGLARHFMGLCRILRADYTAESSSMYYMEGQRSIGLALLELLQEEHPANVAAILTEEKA